MRIFEAIVKALAGIKVDAAFGGAGEQDAALLLALNNSKTIRPVITRHEQAASFMACGYAMYTDRLGVCFATAGPGAFNLISGLSVALTESYPVLAIVGASRLKWRGKGALHETSGLGRTPNARQIFDAVTKKAYELTDVAQTCDVLDEAVNIAFHGRPGPVLIAVPQDLADPHVSVDNYHDIRLAIQPSSPDPASIVTVAQVIADAVRNEKQIVVLAGFGAVYSRAGADIMRLVEHLQIPVITTMDAKGIISESDPLALGVFGEVGHASAREAYKQADVVLAVGNSFAQYDTFNFQPDMFQGKTLIHINIDPGEINKVYHADYAIVADARLAIAALADEVSRSLPAAQARRYPTQGYDIELPEVGSRIHPGDMVKSLSRLLPPNAIVLGDAGTHTPWLAFYLELSNGQTFRKVGSFGTMAGYTNGAIGVKVAHPDRVVVSGCGDGCYLMAGFELLTAVQYEIPVIWIIFDDGEFKLVRLHQLETYHEFALTDFTNPDYVAYAKACGADAYRAETLGEFEQAFQKALSSSKPTLIDARITRLALPPYSPSPEGLVEGLWNAIRLGVGSIVR